MAAKMLGSVESRNPHYGFYVNSEGKKVPGESVSYGLQELDGERGVYIGGQWLSVKNWGLVSAALTKAITVTPG